MKMIPGDLDLAQSWEEWGDALVSMLQEELTTNVSQDVYDSSGRIVITEQGQPQIDYPDIVEESIGKRNYFELSFTTIVGTVTALDIDIETFGEVILFPNFTIGPAWGQFSTGWSFYIDGAILQPGVQYYPGTDNQYVPLVMVCGLAAGTHNFQVTYRTSTAGIAMTRNLYIQETIR